MAVRFLGFFANRLKLAHLQHSYAPIFLSKSNIRLQNQRRWFSTERRSENYDTHRVRNIGIIAHVDAGKTTTSERMLFYSGESKHIGDVDDGNTVMDFMPLERQRGITIQSAAITFYWNNSQINLIDTPGHVDFTVEVERSIRVLDGCVAIFDSVAGVQAQSVTVWKQTQRYGVPRIAFLNKMDREGANVERTANMIAKQFKVIPLVLQRPIGTGITFRSVIDLITMEKIDFQGENGEHVTRSPLDADALKRATPHKQKLIEQLAECDEKLMELYLEDKPIDAAQIHKSVKTATLSLKGVPILMGSSLKNIGVQPLLDAVANYFPNPLECAEPEIFVTSKKSNESKKQAHSDKLTLKRDNTGNGPLCALAFKVVHDQHRGLIVYCRVYSGTLKAGQKIINAQNGEQERIVKLVRILADQHDEVEEIRAGDIGAVIGLKNTSTGDTIVAQDDVKRYKLEYGGLPRLGGVVIPPPVFLCTLETDSSKDERALMTALELLNREDPSFQYINDPESGDLLIRGMGELHLEILHHRLVDHYKANCKMGEYHISYRSTLLNEMELSKTLTITAAGKPYDIYMEARVYPTERGIGNSFEASCPLAENSAQIVEALETGAMRSLASGIALHLPSVDTGVEIKQFNASPDTPLPVVIAASQKLVGELCSNACQEENFTLLEPVMSVEIEVKDKYQPAVVGDITGSKRGHVVETDFIEGSDRQIVRAEIPLKSMIAYSSHVRSLTQGNASFTMEFCRYGELSSNEKEIVVKKLRGY